ncbi:MAG TPA: TIGR01777 family oxidoreductase [Gemmatimonadaceae bacterium]|nr:TIGR01777 family oxidoreductase [Gemmatimonadaceae bacterium]
MLPDPLASQAPISIAITGATGLIGSALVERLRAHGHTVRRLVRSPRDAREGDVVWDAERSELATPALRGVDAVVNLAGAPIAKRWTAERRRDIRNSRVAGTQSLARAIAAMEPRPRVLLNASAVGYYGSRGDEVLSESSAPGSGFLAGVTVEWERATAAAAEAGVRVVLLRTGVVLSAKGGALAKMLPPFRLGMGGPLGSGEQWMSWIALEDHLHAMEHALFVDSVSGPVNLVSPNPVRNLHFATTLGRVLTRPAVIPVPAVALELLYGEMARETILASQRALPAALSASGFDFQYPTLEGALRATLG